MHNMNADWKNVVDRFYEGDATPDELRALLTQDELSAEGTLALSDALALAEQLTGLCAPMAPPSSEDIEAALDVAPPPANLPEGDDAPLPALAHVLAAMPGPPTADELGLPEPTLSELRPAVAERGRRLLVEVVEVCGASEATLWLLHADGERLRGALNVIRGGGHHPELEGLEVPVAASAIGVVIRTEGPAKYAREDYQDPVATWTSGVEVESMITAPVRLGGGRVCGVLSAINPPGREAFSEKDLEALSWKAYLVGLVLQEALRTQPAPWATQD